MTFTTGDDTEGRISLRISEALGTAWIDDVRLTEGASPAVTPIFVREFTKGVVIVLPSDSTDFVDSAIQLPLPTPMKPLRADGILDASVSSISLRNGDAAILLKP
jgi:hypothetical protein